MGLPAQQLHVALLLALRMRRRLHGGGPAAETSFIERKETRSRPSGIRSDIIGEVVNLPDLKLL